MNCRVTYKQVIVKTYRRGLIEADVCSDFQAFLSTLPAFTVDFLFLSTSLLFEFLRRMNRDRVDMTVARGSASKFFKQLLPVSTLQAFIADFLFFSTSLLFELF